MDKIQLWYSNLVSLCVNNFGYFSPNRDFGWQMDGQKLERDNKFAVSYGFKWGRILSYAPWHIKFSGNGAEIPAPEMMFTPYKWNPLKKKFEIDAYNEGWNDRYFQLIEKFVASCNSRGREIWITLFDSCQFAYEICSINSPWANNTRGIPNFFDQRAIGHVGEWVDKIVSVLGKYNVGFEIGNELSGLANRYDKGWIKEWFTMVATKLRDLGIDRTRINYGFDLHPTEFLGYNEQGGCEFRENCQYWEHSKGWGEDIWGDKERHDVARQVHGAGAYSTREHSEFQNGFGDAYDQVVRWIGKSRIKFRVSNDGVRDGQGCDTYDGKTRPGPERMKTLVKDFAQYAEYYPGRILEHIPKNFDESCQAPTLQAMAEGYQESFGEWPEGYDPDSPNPDPNPNPDLAKIRKALKKFAQNQKAAAGEWFAEQETIYSDLIQDLTLQEQNKLKVWFVNLIKRK